jgi:hypothetical protein
MVFKENSLLICEDMCCIRNSKSNLNEREGTFSIGQAYTEETIYKLPTGCYRKALNEAFSFNVSSSWMDLMLNSEELNSCLNPMGNCHKPQ